MDLHAEWGWGGLGEGMHAAAVPATCSQPPHLVHIIVSLPSWVWKVFAPFPMAYRRVEHLVTLVFRCQYAYKERAAEEPVINIDQNRWQFQTSIQGSTIWSFCLTEVGGLEVRFFIVFGRKQDTWKCKPNSRYSNWTWATDSAWGSSSRHLVP